MRAILRVAVHAIRARWRSWALLARLSPARVLRAE